MNNSTMKFMSLWLYMLTIYLALSSKNMFIIWVMIELNMMIFIPLHNKHSVSNYNNLMKYYLMQSISSAFLLMIILIQHHFKISLAEMQLTMSTILLMKLGLFPFSSWYFQITENMEWKMWFLINTLQKIIPIWLISNFTNTFFILNAVLYNSLYSSVEMWSQSSFRWLLNCSSLNHISWVLVSLNSYINNWEMYMLIYIVMSYTMYQIIKKFNNKTLMNNFNMTLSMKIMFCLNLMNFIGIPPMLGFMPKFLVLYSSKSLMIMAPLILNNVIMAYFYISMMKNMMNNKIMHKFDMNNKMNMNQPTLIMLTTLMFFMLILI